MNLSGTLNAFRLLLQPSLCLPHSTISTFDKIPIPVSKALVQANGGKEPDIRVVLLDKDNCFARPRENVVYPPYKSHFEALRLRYPGKHLLVVSNSAGTTSDPEGAEAGLLHEATGVEVFRHSTKKPGCGKDVFEYLRSHEKLGVTHPGQVAVIGDRLFTDILMANLMGAWGIWVEDGVLRNDGMFSRLERGLPPLLYRFGLNASKPQDIPCRRSGVSLIQRWLDDKYYTPNEDSAGIVSTSESSGGFPAYSNLGVNSLYRVFVVVVLKDLSSASLLSHGEDWARIQRLDRVKDALSASTGSERVTGHGSIPRHRATVEMQHPGGGIFGGAMQSALDGLLPSSQAARP